VILAPLGHVQFRKSLIFVAILRGEPQKGGISSRFRHLRPVRRHDFSGKPGHFASRRVPLRGPKRVAGRDLDLPKGLPYLPRAGVLTRESVGA
jgi:hypothetical protein